jgi:hypothetical protein
LRAAKLKQGNHWGAGAFSNLIQWAGRFRNYLFRRSPWYPKMEVTRLDQLSAFERNSFPEGVNEDVVHPSIVHK